MIIWKWLMAKAFSSYEKDSNIIIFASWVSNSKCDNNIDFKREVDLLKKVLNSNKNKLLIYFSTCSIYDKSLTWSKYINHKIWIEKIIKNNKNNNFIIVRISNPVWYTNNNFTLLNYLINKINNKEKITILSYAKRNLIDIDDLFKIVSYIISNRLFINKVVNVANNNNNSIFEIMKWIEEITWKKWMYNIEKRWGEPNINLEEIKSIIKKCNINFNEDYLINLLNKYYNP